jgi:S1-C subfamily serine protease
LIPLEIVTNNPVIKEADSFSVKTKDSSTCAGTLIGKDDYNDAPVLHIPITTKDFLNYDTEAYFVPYLTKNICNTEAYHCYGPTLEIGEKDYALGNLEGIQGTFIEGIVSNRLSQGSFSNPGPSVIVTTATINPGSSGGALLDEFGHHTNITEADNQQGLYFAIPMNVVVDSIIHVLADYHEEAKCSILEANSKESGSFLVYFNHFIYVIHRITIMMNRSLSSKICRLLL